MEHRDVYREALDKAKEEYLAIELERDKLDSKLDKLKQTISGLAGLLGDTAEVDRLGLADCLRILMEEHYDYLTPAKWRDRLGEKRFSSERI